MREYETIVVLRPDSGETQTNQLLERVDGMIERHGGSIIQKKNWGKRELAYRVQKYNQGVYYYYNYAGEAETVSNLERALRLHEIPMKYLTVKLNDTVDVEARKKELAELMEASAVPAPEAAPVKTEAAPVKTEATSVETEATPVKTEAAPVNTEETKVEETEKKEEKKEAEVKDA